MQIGTGTLSSPTTLYSPFYRFSNSSATDFSRSNIIVTASELAAVGVTNGAIINKIAFNKTNAGATTGNAVFQIYMANSTNNPPLSTTTTWASILSTHTMVYSSSAQSIPATIGWLEFIFTTPFVYNGGSIEIATHWDISSVSGNPATDKITWEYTDGFATYNIGAVGTTSAPATLNATTTGYKHRPNIKITYVLPNQPMVYDSSTTIQPITTPILGIQNQQVIAALKVNVTGNQTPFDLTSVVFNTNGSTNTADISKAQLFYTQSSTFSNALQVGSDVINPSGNFTFTPSSNNTLSYGANYFWLTYDIAAGTAEGNIIDAECTGFTLSGAGGTQTPTVTNPGSGRQVLFPLTGIKTINSALPSSTTNYQSFTSAITALNSVGVGTGGVTFNVASGTYTEQININQYTGVSASNPVVFQSATGINTDVILQFTPTSTANYVLQFNGADYISIKNMTIQLTGTISSYACVVSGIGMSDYITLFGNKFIGYIGTGTTTAYATVWFQSGATNISNNVTIQNNIIQNGSYSIYIYGSSTTVLETGNTIIGNTIENFYYYGIYSYYQDAIKIENNIIYGSQTAYSTQYGLYMGYNDNASTCLNNRIHARGTSTSYALYPYYSDGQSGQEVLIANNFITISQSTGTAYGLYSYYGNYQKIYHNSINITSGSATAGIGMLLTSPATGTYGNIDVKNNNIANTGPGYAISIPANSVTLGYVSAMDYNNYYVSGVNIGSYNGIAVANLPAWQTASSKDANSLSVNPLFNTATNLYPGSPSLNASCPLLSDVPNDIDGMPRNSPTDMGAVEFTPVSDDIALLDGELVRVSQCLNTNDSLYFTIQNLIGSTIDFSTDPLTIQWFVTGPVNSNGTITLNSGTLALNNQLIFGGDGVNMSVSGLYKIQLAYLDANNLNLNQLNDTVSNISSVTVPVFNFNAQPDNTLIINNTTQVPLNVNSNLFPSGDFFFSEIAQFKTTIGAPTAGWPSYLIADDYVEITGVPGSDLSGYKIEIWGASAILGSWTLGSGTVLSPAGTCIIATGQLGSSVTSPSNYYYHLGNTSSLGSTTVQGYILKSPSNAFVDVVVYGTFTFPVAAGVTPADWTGNTPALSSSGNRLVGQYTKDATNWINSGVSPQDPNTVNAGVVLPTPGGLTGFTWSLNGNILSHNNPDTIVGPFTVNGIYNYVASYNTTCGLFTDTAKIEVMIPLNDLKILAITSPDENFCFSGTKPVSISLTNLGTAAVNTPFTASYKVDAGIPVTETVILTVNPLDTVNYTFPTQVNLPAPTADVIYSITAYISLTGDPFQTNDTISKTVTSGYVPSTPIANSINSYYADTALLVATPGSLSDTIINWYQNINDTAYFHSGLTYTTPVLFDTATYWISASKSGSNSGLLITEINIGDPDGIEIQNISGSTINTTGWVVAVSNNYSDINAVNANIWTIGSSVTAGQLLIRDDASAGGQYWGSNLLWNPGAYPSFTGWAMIIDNTGKIVDYLAWGWKSANIQAFSATINGYPITIGSKWSGDGIVDPANNFIVRQFYDNNNSTDFTNTTTGSIGTANPGMINSSGGGSALGCESNRVPIKAMISNFPAVDAGISTLILPSGSVNQGSSVAINARIKNYGLNNLTTATIGWSINGVVQTPYQWTGNITRGDTSAIFNIADYTANLPGVFEIQAWSYNPNGSIDTYAINDTSTGSFNVNLIGNFTIGTSGADFSTVNQAVNLLNTVGIGGNVIFNIQPGTYTEKVIINQINGADDSKGITFQSENMDSTSVIISDSSLAATDNYILRLNGTDYITIKNLTIRNKGVTYGRVIDMLGGTNFVNIANNVIESSATGTASTTAGIYSTTSIDSNMVIENNSINNGYYGIFLSGTSTTVKESNNIIRNNKLLDFYYYGIYSYYQNYTTITNNYLLNRANASSQYGLSSYYNDNATITKNQIYVRGNGSGTTYGVYMYYNNNTSGNGLFANNFIAQSNGTGTVYGIYNTNSKNTKFFYNSISITKGSATVASNVAYYITGTTTGTKLLNNIFSNTKGGYAAYFSSTIIDSSNYNCLFSTGSNLVFWGALRTDLAAYQAASGRDAYSVSIYPQFTDSTMNLHINNPALTQIATSVPEITDDIDGQIRGFFPTIGADEFIASKTLNLTLYLEGLFNGVDMNPAQDDMGDHWGSTIADVITVELHDAVNPSIIQATFTNQMLNTNGSCTVTIPSSLSDSYYIVIKHRNSIQTWSEIPLGFTNSPINYDFSIAASKAFGDNQIEVSPGVYALFVGDVNQDEVIDLSDLVEMDTDLTNGTVAYVVYDLNGDGVVDLSDLVAIDVNLTNGIVALYP